MGIARTVSLTGLGGLILVGGVVAVKTVTFSPADVATAEGVVVATGGAEIDANRAALNLSQAIRFKTVSHQNPEENQIEEWDKLQLWLAKTYPTAHAAMKREIVGGKALVYTWTGSDPSLPAIILMAHQDVVPVTEGTEPDWKHEPFAGQVAEGAVWGRGSVDDKGALVALFEAFDALAQQGFKPKRTIYLVSGHDEEAGGTGAKTIASLLQSRGVKALFTLDEGSAIILDEPLTKAPVALIGIAEKGYATLKVTAKAPGGHSSMPPKDTGVINLAKALIAINDKPFPLELRGPGEKMIAVLAGQKGGMTKVAVANQWLFSPLLIGQVGKTPTGAAMFHTTIAPTMLEGSPKENVLPQSANALINYRIAPWNQSSDVMQRAKSAVGKLPVELSWVKEPREPSKVSSTTSAGWKMIRATIEAESPQTKIAPFLVVAGTDSRNFQGISDDVYRFMPVQFKLSDTAMIHGTNEHMPIKDLNRIINFYIRLIKTSAG